jgi:pantetheine-phosphate adenylyltransferase
MKSAFFPGSFDPFTKGHESLVLKALTLFDEVIIGLGVNSQKASYFETSKRILHMQSLFTDTKCVKVVSFEGLTVEFCKKNNINFIVRGLRDVKDFEYEKSIAGMNLEISGIETVFFMCEPKLSAINATIVREIHKNGGIIETFVTNSNILVD